MVLLPPEAAAVVGARGGSVKWRIPGELREAGARAGPRRVAIRDPPAALPSASPVNSFLWRRPCASVLHHLWEEGQARSPSTKAF